MYAIRSYYVNQLAPALTAANDVPLSLRWVGAEARHHRRQYARELAARLGHRRDEFAEDFQFP